MLLSGKLRTDSYSDECVRTQVDGMVSDKGQTQSVNTLQSSLLMTVTRWTQYGLAVFQSHHLRLSLKRIYFKVIISGKLPATTV